MTRNEVKARKNEAAVAVDQGTTRPDIALEIARSGQSFHVVDKLFDDQLVLEGQASGRPLRQLLTIQFLLAKDSIKQVRRGGPECGHFSKACQTPSRNWNRSRFPPRRPT